MEDDSNIDKNGKGIVNHGFTVEFSSEEEEISDVDVSNISFAPKERASVYSCTSSISKLELTPTPVISAPQALQTTNDTNTRTIQVHPIVSATNNANTGDNEQPYSTSTSALPSNT